MKDPGPDTGNGRNAVTTVLIATNHSQTVIAEYTGMLNGIACDLYGVQSAEQPPQSRQGFNGELRETLLEGYALGAGYRVYSPLLRRFHAMDELSPFGAGGLNAYGYCTGDPLNNVDPSGRFGIPGLAKVMMWAASERWSFRPMPRLNQTRPLAEIGRSGSLDTLAGQSNDPSTFLGWNRRRFSLPDELSGLAPVDRPATLAQASAGVAALAPSPMANLPLPRKQWQLPEVINRATLRAGRRGNVAEYRLDAAVTRQGQILKTENPVLIAHRRDLPNIARYRMGKPYVELKSPGLVSAAMGSIRKERS